jgi:hypothetical protein
MRKTHRAQPARAQADGQQKRFERRLPPSGVKPCPSKPATMLYSITPICCLAALVQPPVLGNCGTCVAGVALPLSAVVAVGVDIADVASPQASA